MYNQNQQNERDSDNLERQNGQNDNLPYFQGIYNGLNNLGNQIGHNNGLLLANVQEIVRKNEILSRKKRRVRTGEQLLVPEDKPLYVQFCYDNGECETKVLTNDVTGRFKVYTLNFDGRQETEQFGIYFENEVIMITGSKSKVRGAYMYECFVRAGIRFNSSVPESLIKKLLFRFWAPKIEQDSIEADVFCLPGWDQNKFYHKDNFVFPKTVDFPDVPIFKKNFSIVGFTDQVRAAYFKELKNIRGWRERLLISVFPFTGLLSTLINESHKPLKIFLNFVMMDTFPVYRIPAWMQIFNRKRPVIYSLDMTDKEITQILADAKDEVLIFDAIPNPDDSDYKKRKLLLNAQKVSDAITGGKSPYSNTAQHKNACVILSAGKMLKRGAINIVVDSELCETFDMCTDFMELQVMEAVFAQVVSFAEDNMPLVQQVIRRKRECDGNQEEAFQITFDVLKMFWKGEGIDLEKELQLPENWSFDEMFKDHADTLEDMLTVFIKAVRKGIRRYYVRKKGYGIPYEERTIYYDDLYLYFPTSVLKDIIFADGLQTCWQDIFIELKGSKVLVSDQDGGMSRQLQVDGRRFEVYQISLPIFNQVGLADIVSLGKEEEQYER